MSMIILSVMIGVIAVLGTGSFLVLRHLEQKRLHQRSISVIKGQVATDGVKTEKNAQDKRRAEIAKKLQEENAHNKPKKKGDLKQKLIQAGMTITPLQFWLFSAIFAVVVMALMIAWGKSKPVVFFITVFAFLGVPRWFLRRKILKRQKKFLEEFADALEAMVRLLKAGMPVGEAIAMASQEFEGPVGEEMSRIYDAQKVGVSLSDAVNDAAKRMPITEMQMFATGITIQAQTGSSLSEILLNLARVIRARFKLKRKIQALSAEAKASAMIIGSLPFLVGGGLYLINKQYMSVFFNTLKGELWLAGSGLWMLLGCLVMRAMINFKI